MAKGRNLRGPYRRPSSSSSSASSAQASSGRRRGLASRAAPGEGRQRVRQPWSEEFGHAPGGQPDVQVRSGGPPGQHLRRVPGPVPPHPPAGARPGPRVPGAARAVGDRTGGWVAPVDQDQAVLGRVDQHVLGQDGAVDDPARCAAPTATSSRATSRPCRADPRRPGRPRLISARVRNPSSRPSRLARRSSRSAGPNAAGSGSAAGSRRGTLAPLPPQLPQAGPPARIRSLSAGSRAIFSRPPATA